MDERKYYVVKITIEDAHETQVITPYDDYLQAVINYHEIIKGTLAYDTVKVMNCMLVDDYFNVVDGLRYRYERSDVTPGE